MLLLSLAIGVLPLLASSQTSYVGAVVEHDPFMGTDADSAVSLLSQNLNVYSELSRLAGVNNVNVIVFPEFGLTSVRDSERTSLYPFAETYPNPSLTVPCSNPEYQTNDHIILRSGSCMAANSKVSVLINTIEKMPCGAEDSSCPSDLQYLYNTDLMFDENGALVGKYHKSNEWPGLMPPYNEVKTKEYVTYNASFGVEFGLFTCFDIMHADPPVKYVDNGIKHFLYPVQQGQIGEKTIISGWSKKHSVTLLSSNLGAKGGEGAGDCSGILKNGEDLPTNKVYLKDFNAQFKDFNDNILIGVVPK